MDCPRGEQAIGQRAYDAGEGALDKATHRSAGTATCAARPQAPSHRSAPPQATGGCPGFRSTAVSGEEAPGALVSVQ